MDEEVEVCLVHPPGRESRFREAPLQSVVALASGLAREMLSLIDRPYVFFGHSLGGVVAFEAARLLRRQGHRLPELLIVSASRAPQLSWPYPPVGHLPDLDLLREIHSRYDSIPAQIMESAELRTLVVSPLRADISALEEYLYSAAAPLPFGIRVFGGRTDHMVSERSLEGWREHTSTNFGRKWFDGGHLFLQTARKDVMNAVAAELDTIRFLEAERSFSPVGAKKPPMSAWNSKDAQ